MERASMNQNAQFSVVLDIDGTTPPIRVVSGPDREYLEPRDDTRCQRTADFRNEYRRPDEKGKPLAEACRSQLRSCCACDKDCQKKFWLKRFPVWRIMRRYQWKQDFASDLVSGLTVGIMQLPQGMAYSLLAELPPVVGLYMAFFPVLIYFFLGTSRHISMGTVALCSLLTGSVISRFYDPALAPAVLGPDVDVNDYINTSAVDTANETESFTYSDDPVKVDLPNHAKITIAASLCLLVGFAQFGMGILRMGFITTYMSDPMIGGFTTGAAVHVGTSQVKYVFGLKIPRSDGVFQIVKTYILIFKHIADTNLPTLIMSIICMIIIYLVKVQVNQRFKHKLKFPIPVELFVVIAATVLSRLLNFSDKFHMKIVGEIPAGLPKPTMPSLPMSSVYTVDVFVIAIVAFSQCVGLAALMAKKHGYSFDANQELIAYGAGNIFASFFSCYPYAASVSRSSVQESAGGKTQLASVFSATLVLIVIVSIGPLFESLPNCALASIIMVALRSLFLQFLELPKIWKTSVYDFWIWIVTFLAVVILHVDYGILIGMVFSFFTVVIRTQRTKAENLQKIEDVQLYESSSQYSKTQSVTGLKVIGLTAPLYFANGALFAKQVYDLVGIAPEKRRKQLKKLNAMHDVSVRSSTQPLVNESNEFGSSQSVDVYSKEMMKALNEWTGEKFNPNPNPSIPNTNQVYYVVLDFSCVNFIDTVGAKTLKQLVDDYAAVKIKVVLGGVNDDVWRVLEVTEFLKSYENRIFLTVDDAVNAMAIEAGSRRVSTTKYPQRMMYRENNNPYAEEGEMLLAMESTF